jgi:hypothetical protein
VAIPNVVNMTVQAGQYALAELVVTHSGDIPLGHVAFAPPGGPLPPIPWAMFAIGCTGDDYFTPCRAVIQAIPPSTVAPGVYTTQVVYKSYDANLTAAATVKITVVPP